MSKKITSWKQGLILLLLLSFLSGMAFLSFFVAQKSRAELVRLTELELPLFDNILTLQSNFTMQESELYSYYVTADRDKFQNAFQLEKQQLNHVLNAIKRQLPDSRIIHTLNQKIDELWLISERFDAVMNGKPIDWDEAREVLSEFAPLAASLTEENKRLSKWMREIIIDRSHESSQLTQITLWTTTLIAAFSLFAAAAMAWLNSRRLVAYREQKRLSSFPERSPLPIISISEKGHVNYANDHARSLARTLLDSDNVEQLLPADLASYLTSAKTKLYIEKEYPVLEHIFRIMLHWLDDFSEYHLYLTDVTETRNAHERLKELAYFDSLTGLPNFTSFQEEFRRINPPTSVEIEIICLIEIMQFERVISTGGHKVSDGVVLDCAARLNKVLWQIHQAPYRLYRFDSNRFCLSVKIVHANMNGLFSALDDAFVAPFRVSTYEFYLSLNIGVTQLTETNIQNIELALKEADSALQEVKNKNRSFYQFYDPSIHDKQLAKLAIETNLRHALENNELHLVFQPQLCLSSGKIIGAETLLRWQHHDQSISPADFIPLAEESGLIIQIGEWIIRKSCEYAKMFNLRAQNELVIAINISAKQLVHGNLVSVIKQALQETGLASSCLEIEITESATMSDFDQALSIIQEIRKLGIRIALDDFGTGYSSLSYLHKLPINKLKVDQSFIRNMIKNPRDASITHSIITLAKGLQLKVIGEGIEHFEQLAQLKAWGCHEIQGFLFAKPLSAEMFIERILSHDDQQWR